MKQGFKCQLWLAGLIGDSRMFFGVNINSHGNRSTDRFVFEMCILISFRDKNLMRCSVGIHSSNSMLEIFIFQFLSVCQINESRLKRTLQELYVSHHCEEITTHFALWTNDFYTFWCYTVLQFPHVINPYRYFQNPLFLSMSLLRKKKSLKNLKQKFQEFFLYYSSYVNSIGNKGHNTDGFSLIIVLLSGFLQLLSPWDKTSSYDTKHEDRKASKLVIFHC